MGADTITAICALVVSVCATILAVWSARTQRRHMRLSVQPIAAIPIADFEDKVRVSLANRGLGPMRVTRFTAHSKDGVSEVSLVKHMPQLEPGVSWRTFYGGINGYVIEARRSLELLVLEGDPENEPFRKSRDGVRKALSTLTVHVEYEDLYGNPMDPEEKRLSWFGRHEG